MIVASQHGPVLLNMQMSSQSRICLKSKARIIRNMEFKRENNLQSDLFFLKWTWNGKSYNKYVVTRQT
jgi:hypothetical protein